MSKEPRENHDPQQDLSKDSKNFAADLMRLRPRDDRLDRERLAFLVGQAAAIEHAQKDSNSQSVLANRAWPAAFAAMTAVAASLLVLLVTRPDRRDAQLMVSDDRIHGDIKQLFVIEGAGGRRSLTTGEARFGNLEARLAQLETERTGAEVSDAVGNGIQPVLTPSAWQRVIDETEPPIPQPHEASSLNQSRGLKS